jgi:ligand-binding SRPBCC domain-containing protein
MTSGSVLERSVRIAAPVEEVFAFHLDTRNAALISPRSMRVLGVEGTFPVVAGARVVMRLRPAGSPIAMSWRVRIEEVEAPARIVDVAERSPFASWRHEHLFRSAGGGGCEMTDRLEYRLPGGPVGRLADRLLVRRRLEHAFAERHRLTREVLERAARGAAGG